MTSIPGRLRGSAGQRIGQARLLVVARDLDDQLAHRPGLHLSRPAPRGTSLGTHAHGDASAGAIRTSKRISGPGGEKFRITTRDGPPS